MEVCSFSFDRPSRERIHSQHNERTVFRELNGSVARKFYVFERLLLYDLCSHVYAMRRCAWRHSPRDGQSEMDGRHCRLPTDHRVVFIRSILSMRDANPAIYPIAVVVSTSDF